MRNFQISPWFWLLNTATYLTTAIFLYGEDYMELAFLVAVGLSLMSAALTAKFARDCKTASMRKLIGHDPVRLWFERSLSECEPAEAAWLRLQFRADFEESIPVHPHAKAVIESLSPPKQDKPAAVSSNVEFMENELEDIASLLKFLENKTLGSQHMLQVKGMMARSFELTKAIRIAKMTQLSGEVERAASRSLPRTHKAIQARVERPMTREEKNSLTLDTLLLL